MPQSETMKSKSIHRWLHYGLFAFIVTYTVASFAATPAIKHTLLVSGTGLDYVGIVDTTGKIVWKHDESEASNGQKNDCWLLTRDEVIYAYQWGVRIVDIRSNKVIWDRPTPKRNNKSAETHSCQPIDGGSKILIPECFQDTAFIVEVDTAKKELRRIALKNQGGGTHGKWRQIRKTSQNTYLVSSYDLKHSFEYDTAGNLIHDFPAGGYVATRLENGNTLIGTGDDCRFVEFNPAGTKIWEINNSTAAVSGLGIGFGSEAQRLSNGNTIITNWGGHGSGFGAAVIEVKSDRTVVGALPESFPTRIASVKVIDDWRYPVCQFSINAAAGPDGSIEPSGEISVDSASEKTFLIKADAGCTVDSVIIDGVSIGSVLTYTFKQVNKSHTIRVVFKRTVHAGQLPKERSAAMAPEIKAGFNGTIHVRIPFEGTSFIRVFDCIGKEIEKKTVQGSGSFQFMNRLVNGSYSIVVESDMLKKEWKKSIVIGAVRLP